MKKIVTFIIFAGAISIVATSAFAAPTYLTCEMEMTGSSWPIELTINEENQSVTVYIPVSGSSTRSKGVFSPKEVKFVDNEASIYYVVSRIDLKLRRTLVIGASSLDDIGVCKVAPLPKRAF